VAESDPAAATELTDEQLERLRRFAVGDVLFRPGDVHAHLAMLD
jgi:hypothetical protein